MKDIWSNWRGLGWQNHNFEKSNSNIKSAIQPNAKIQSHQVTEHHMSKKMYYQKSLFNSISLEGVVSPSTSSTVVMIHGRAKKYHYALPPLKTHAEPPRTQGSTLIYAIHTRGVVRPQEGATKNKPPRAHCQKWMANKGWSTEGHTYICKIK